MELINNHPDKNWDWYELSRNDFAIDKEQYITSKLCRISLVSMADEDYFAIIIVVVTSTAHVINCNQTNVKISRKRT